jgi:RHS repeat-associated protein
MEIGFKPYGSYHGGDLDSVNLSNGFLNLHIPLVSYPQRGDFSYTAQLLYNNSKGWSVLPNCSNQNTCNPVWQWKGKGIELSLQSPDVFTAGPGPYVNPSNIIVYKAITSDFATHQMALTPAGNAESIDGSGLWQNGSAFGNPGFARDRRGVLNNGQLEDPNGNIFTLSSGTLGDMIDTLGRTFPNSANQTASDSSGCTGPLPISGASIYSFPGYKGLARQIKLCSATVQLQSNFQTSGYYNDLLFPIAEGHTTRSMLQSVVLYNGTDWTHSPAWAFEYSSRNVGDSQSVNYGDLTKITLPTGGTISYAWGSSEICGITNTPLRRFVISRTVNANDGTGDHTWNYNSQVVTDPDGNDTVHTFTGLNASCSLYETQTQYYQGPHQAGVLLKTVKTDYRWMANPFDSLNGTQTTPTVTNVFPIRVTTTLANGKTTKTETDYDSSLVFNVPGRGQFTGSYGKVTETREFDYGDNGIPGGLLRRADYTYAAMDGSPLSASYLSFNMLDLVSSITIYDGGSHQVAQTKYRYDESSLQPSGVSTQFSTAPPNAGIRGNRTSQSQLLISTGATVTATTTYYDTGTPYQVTDPGGHITTNTYDAGFQNGQAFAGAYITETKNALQQGTFVDYDFNTGLPIAAKDPNGAVTTSDYDVYGRTKQKVAPDTGTTTWNYNDVASPTFTVTSPITSTVNHVGEGNLDGLGRMSHSKLVSDPQGTDTVDTTYDGRGEVFTISNPHRTAAGATDGITTTIHDAVGRVTQTTKQDGSISKMVYDVATSIQVNGDCNIATDEAGNQRGTCLDALGRLVEVDEPNPGNPINVNYKATLLTDGNFVLENAAGTGIWSTGTSGSNASSIYMQDDGNLVLYVFKWSAGTYATPSAGPFPAQGCSIGSYLMVNQRLNANQCIVSPHGQYLLYMGSDGNFYIYDVAHNVGTWGPGTYGHPGAYAIMQGDGNLCVYTATNTYLWCSGTGGTNADRLDMEDDGRIIIYKSAWNSGTSDGQFYGTAVAHPGCDAGIGTGWTGVLGSGQCFVSPNGHFELLMQTDGNLVIYDLSVSPAHALWSTNTAILPTDPAVAMRTLYSYDTLGNLLRVDQKGTAPNDSTQWRTRTFTYDSLSRLLTATNPESGTISYTYDSDGNLLQKTSPAPNPNPPQPTQTVSYCYDALHRVTGKGYGAQNCPLTTPVVSYVYDSGTNAIGHLTSLTDQAGIATYTYDNMGRLASEARPIAGVSKTTSYTYYFDGSVKTLTYPSGRVLTYTPDSAGRPASVVDGNGTQYVSSTTYYPNGAEYQRFMPNIYFRTDLNSRLQVSGFYSDNGQTSSFFINKTYNYGAVHQNNGDVMSITNNKDSNRTQTFTYDQLNRITAGSSSANTGNYSWGENYAVDAWGNLQITPMSGKAHGGNFTHSGTVQNQAAGLGYDAAGNLTNYTSPGQYVYDQENRLSSTAGMSYTYDGNGERVLKSNTSTGAAVMRYWSMGGNTLAESDGSGILTAEYIYFGGKRVARIDLPTSTVHYYLSDHLGSTSIVASSAGTVEEESDYYPFGTEVVVTGPGVNHYKFTSKERDTESGLDLMGARYNASSLGRLMSSDPSNIGADRTNPQTWNAYSYSLNNPLNLTDPTGLYVCEDSEKCDSQNDKAFAQSLKDAQAAANKLTGDDKAAAQRAINAYGAEGVDNGVNVRFDVNIQGGDAVTEVSGVANGNKSADNPTGQNINVTFKPDAVGRDLSGSLVGHEGSHVADGSDWVKSGFSSSLDPTRHTSEMSANHVQFNLLNSMLGTMSGPNGTYKGSLYGGTVRWNKGDTFKMITPDLEKAIRKSNGALDMKPAFTKGAVLQP